MIWLQVLPVNYEHILCGIEPHLGVEITKVAGLKANLLSRLVIIDTGLSVSYMSNCVESALHLW